MNDSTHPGKARILVVEDEENIRSGLCDLLAYHGHWPTPVDNGEEGLRLGLSQPFDLVILDVMLPGVDGFEVCRRLREDGRRDLPILMLTAKGAEDDIVQGLRRGADDYVTKPFSLRELVARIEALLRRFSPPARPDTFEFGPWTVAPGELRATAGERTVDLTPRELDLLVLLHRHHGQVVDRKTLLEEVWDLHNVDEIETRTVDVHIAKLRKKIDASASDGPSLIETVRGIGYRARHGAP